MFDSHCHLNFKAFNDDAQAVANAMNKNRVAGLVVGCDSTSSRYAVDLAQTFDNLWASIGLHPIHVLDDPWDTPKMKDLALEEKVVAIGEVGLDFYRLPEDKKEKERAIAAQYETFEQAIQLASDLDKPLVIHSRNAYDEIIDVLASKPAIQKSSNPGTIHCFMGNRAQAGALLDLGFMIGFTGVITYNDCDSELLEVVKMVPFDRLLIETDAPYLTPEPYRTEGRKNLGKTPRNLPQYTLEVAKTIGKLRDKKFMEIVTLTETNAANLFQIELPKGWTTL
jgi:TatD DNase family protein